MRLTPCLAALLCLALPCRADKPTLNPLTVAEKSDYKATARHADVVAFCAALAKLSPHVRLDTIGTSVEGRKLPLLILADPPVSTPAQAVASKKTVVLAVGNIHAGEVDGKEALLMLARDLATGKDRALLKDLVVLMVPIFNADGNDKMSKDNRREQNGPTEVGIRANAQGLDLNRDFVKLESPEVRALVRLLQRWDPAVLIDTHTTNGSFHRYGITYDGPRHPAGDARLVNAVRDTLLPEIGRRLLQNEKIHSFFYGNFSRDRQRWETYPALPRFGIVYAGLRNRIAILSESYSHAPYRERVRASYAFVRTILGYVAENKTRVRTLLSAARENPPREIALRFRTAAARDPVTILGFVEEEKAGRRVSTGKPHDYKVEFVARCEPTLAVARPFAYLYPARFKNVTENLQRHGVNVEELREDIELDVGAYRIDKVTHGLRPFQKHRLASVEATARKEARRVPAGTILVRTAQPLGTLAAYLLEPQAEDGLCAWNFFDAALGEGKDYPVLRLPAAVPLNAGKVRPLLEERSPKKPIALEALAAGRLPNFSGTPARVLAWLDDGQHFLQMKEGKLLKVHALTGRAQPFFDREKFARSLASIPGMDRLAVQRYLRRAAFDMNPQRTAVLISRDDLYLCPFDGGKAVRLTRTPGAKELASFSPDGQRVAFVRGNNLHVVDVATQTERALTGDGSDRIFNGRADWVYYEEIFDRSRRAYWWSPDARNIAFLRFDDTPVKKFTVIDQIPTRQRVEATPYPKAGDPNPLVKVGIVPAGGGPVRWAERGNCPEDATLIIRVGWTPDSQHVYYYVQDRVQTWLDFCTVGLQGGKPAILFRDTTRAWVEDPGAPRFLKDGSFLFASERSGWKHLYHFARDGKLKQQITTGPWEMRELHAVDEAGGWVYFSGTRDSALAVNLYRARLDGSGLARLTTAPGDHRVQVSPNANLYVDTWSDAKTPARVQLCRADGTPARTLDTNPVHVLDEYDFVPVEFVKIKTPDGFELEGTVVAPRLDSKRRYPVWFKTYGGPHMPTIHDSWYGGRIEDQALARAGYIVFRCDPRSASGKGACSAWTAYKQLGVQELADVETAIRWLCRRSYVDAARIGMSGHSYGGFLTAYCLTHSKLFAAGIAGAPVTDWRNYDSIYTERYMNTPKANAAGYDKTSVVKAAKNLHGRLLLVHGLMDDNVHVQNTVQFVDALERADRDFEMMVYPRARHGIFGKHYRRLTLEFMQRALRPQP